MPVTKLKVTFNKIYANESGDIIGAGEWKLTAKIDGKQVGDSNKEFEVHDKETIPLPEDKWSLELDTTNKKPGDTIEISMKGVDIDVISDDDLGEAKLTLKYPFTKEYDNFPVPSSTIKGWLFFPDHQYFQAHVTVKILEFKATTTPDKNKGILVSRQNSGSSTFTTISGKAVEPRVEVCPVIPVPVSPSALPPRPKAMDTLKAELEPGKETDFAKVLPLTPSLAFNDLVNPTLIPVLKSTDPDLDKKAAKIAVTWVWPGDLDLSQLSWHIKEGPIEFVGSNRGIWVKVRGTDAPADQMAVLEVRWDGEKGPLLATYRAWVGVIKEVPYRINLVNGVDPVKHPERSPTSILTSQIVHDYLQLAKIIWWQSGIELVPDPNTTTWDGATAAGNPSVYIVPAEKDSWTNNVNIDATPIATRLNFNPGVINIVFTRSHSQNRAVASDIQGVSGKDETSTGTPSASWLLPSGVPPDAAAGTTKMKTFPPQKRSNSTDAAYVKARQKVQASFTKDDMKRIYALMYPSVWGGTQQQNGQNLAHELGHVLGLRHRGNGDTDNPPLSDDGVNCLDVKKKKRGHPWLENVMGYDNDRGLDVDLIQTAVVRRHPAAKPKA